jgi:hypothetical protein
MQRTGAGRVFATLFLGVMFGIYKHFTQMRMLQGGRDAYLAVQSQHFDRVAQVHSAPSMVVAGIILAGATFGLYELIVVGITKILPPATVVEE